MKRGVLLFAVALLFGCVDYNQEKTAERAPAEVDYTIEDREAYSRILRSIVAADLNIELKDVDAGIVKTEWHGAGTAPIGRGLVGAPPPYEFRYRVRFTIVAAHGKCSIKGESNYQTVGGIPWHEDDGLTKRETIVFENLVRRIDADLKAP